jgi:NAD(P)-dependent dehydrogenase (short-subunit alcohol dehydrogenase family)
LGLGIVKALISTYTARVVVLSRNKSAELSALPSTLFHFIQCDIEQEGTAKSAISETLKTFGRLDSIVLNAATLDPVAKLENSTSAAWKECFNVNVFSNISLVNPTEYPDL